MYFSEMGFVDRVNYYLQKKIDAHYKVEETQKKIRERNLRYANTEKVVEASTTTVVVYEAEPVADEVDSIAYNSAFYVLNYLNPKNRRKGKEEVI